MKRGAVNRTTWLNAGALMLAITASVLATRPHAPPAPARAETAPLRLADVEEAERIASASTVADALLLELCARERVVSATALSAEGRDAHRYEGLAQIRSLDDVEAIVGLHPDVVVAHNVADPGRVARLRAAGIEVLDLGPLEGRRTLGEDARMIGALCGAAEAGARWADTFERRMQAVSADLPDRSRARALYLTVYGDRFMGGTDGTSYHDVLIAGGLRDAAEADFDGWPTYDVEQILEMDPDVLVTREGMARSLCSHSTLRQLRACPDHVIALDSNLLDDPGPGMLDAAEALRLAAHPRAQSERR